MEWVFTRGGEGEDDEYRLHVLNGEYVWVSIQVSHDRGKTYYCVNRYSGEGDEWGAETHTVVTNLQVAKAAGIDVYHQFGKGNGYE
jgi:hypothetical protein